MFISDNTWQAILMAAAAFLIFSVFSLVNQREQLRMQEAKKQQARSEAISRRDEWRNLQLEYLTKTNYSTISEHAQRLGMISPKPGSETFFYMREGSGE